MWDAFSRRGIKLRPQKRYGAENTFHRGGKVNGKRRARYLVQRRTDSGKIKRGTKCENCGQRADVIEGHHDDYNKPFEIRWLCKKCHFDWHTVNKAIALRS